MSKKASNKNLLLKNWLRGDINQEEEAMLDQFGQDDPFLADALDGYRGQENGDPLREVTQIKAKLRNRYQKKNRGAILWRVAAIGGVLIVALFGIQFLNSSIQTKADNAVAETFAPEPETESATNVTVPIESEESPAEADISEKAARTAGTQSSESKKENSNRNLNKVKPNPSIQEATAQEPPSPKREEAVVVLDETPPTIDGQKIDTNSPPSEEAVAEDAIVPESKDIVAFPNNTPVAEEEAEVIDLSGIADKAINKEEPVIQKTISGLVKDNKGNPVTGAVVLSIQNGYATRTLPDGSFNLNTTTDVNKLKVEHNSFSTLAIDLNGEDYFEVALSQAKNGKKKDRTQGMAKRRSAAEAEVRSSDLFVHTDKESAVQPRIGIPKFELYLRQNLQYPKAAKKKKIRGWVNVQFKVNPDGSLSDFMIRESLGYGCDEEAIRLLENGPKWQAEVETITTYRIEFKEW